MGGLAWLWGATACAAAATVASLVALVYMRGLAPLLGIRNSFWTVLAFSFEPWVWSSGTHGLDYIWGTCSLVAALYYVERRQFSAAGLACAIGFGFRPSSLLWIGPLFVRVLLIARPWRQVLRFVAWSAIPAIIPIGLIVSVIVSRPDAYAGLRTEFNLIPSSILVVYHFVELMGQLPALFLIIAACVIYREQLSQLFRSGEGWVWNYTLIFACLLFQFWIESDKPEYMLPALPGLFMILGRCISNNWWKVITAAFILNAFFSFGLGHASHGSAVHFESIAPSLRPGALLWYADRARESNERVDRTETELSEPSQMVRADPDLDRLDDFYVSSLVKRGPAAQARISCPLVPAFLSFPKGRPPQIRPSQGLPKAPPSYYPILVCCQSMSALVLSNTPVLPKERLKEFAQELCVPKRPM